MNEKIELGDEVKDMISGIKGIAVSKIIFLNGCVQFGFMPRVKKGQEDKLPEEIVADEIQLKIIKKKAFDTNKETEKKKNVGGPYRVMSQGHRKVNYYGRRS